MINVTIIISTFYTNIETVVLLKRWSQVLSWVQAGYRFVKYSFGHFDGYCWVQLSH